jgi:hypothetical protein
MAVPIKSKSYFLSSVGLRIKGRVRGKGQCSREGLGGKGLVRGRG